LGQTERQGQIDFFNKSRLNALLQKSGAGSVIFTATGEAIDANIKTKSSQGFRKVSTAQMPTGLIGKQTQTTEDQDFPNTLQRPLQSTTTYTIAAPQGAAQWEEQRAGQDGLLRLAEFILYLSWVNRRRKGSSETRCQIF
jgi:hypothetical protein